MNVVEKEQPNKALILAKALLSVAVELGLEDSQLAAALGVDRSAISRLRSTKNLKPETKKGEIALHIIRIARALHVLTNGDENWMKAFMHSQNNGTRGVPAEQIASLDGLMRVERYLDAMRGKI